MARRQPGLVPYVFSEWPGLQEVFEEFSPWTTRASDVTVSEDDQHVYVEAALPGVLPKDVEVTFDRGILYIRGEKKIQEEDKKRKFYRRATSTFSYQVSVPGELDDSVEPDAHFEHGVVQITFSKLKAVTPKKIKVKSE
jgi:HSP20 family protein